MGELTSLATQAKIFHLSIKHYCVCPDVSGHKTFREHSVIVMIYENRSLFVFNNSWCGGRFLLMCLTTDVKGVKPKTNSWYAFHESVFPTEYCFCINSICSNALTLVHCYTLTVY